MARSPSSRRGLQIQPWYFQRAHRAVGGHPTGTRSDGALAAQHIRQSSQGTAAVGISQTHGPATYLGTSASDWIPDYLVTGINFNANRAGGAQLPVGGWDTGGLGGYTERF
ncbi:hypothetical protein V8C42DRAFT_348960 [Trichoderma barbatum]